VKEVLEITPVWQIDGQLGAKKTIKKSGSETISCSFRAK
jgi:hypothetical protein